ncbi:MAG: tRNA-dihydrouridine synthase family protein [bacterium]|nr:tRNA-dihydrouridine synthase family protein [bacterium]
MESFWNRLPKPFFAMAPMADVTDPAWRALVARLGSPRSSSGEAGKPDVMFTEFVSADGLYHTREREPNVRHRKSYIPDERSPLMRDLQFSEAERPIVAQFFSAKPEMVAYAATLAEELGFDGVDVNMGCPDRTIEHQGAGAMLIKTPELAQELIRAAQEASPLPVSVKTRIGYNAEMLDEWLPALLEARPAAITLHLRTRKEMSLVPADWGLMKRAVELRDRLAPPQARRAPEVLMIGNGDVRDLDEARAKIAETGCDGVMIGRGMFGNPWVFNPGAIADLNAKDLRLRKLEALVELAHSFEALTPPKHFAILKKHIKAFVIGFDGAAELRASLMQAENANELERLILERRP